MVTIGRYIVRGLLGRGGMGKIYKVELPEVGKIAALKLLDPDPLLVKLMGTHPLHELFLSEATTMARLQHPNIVALHDFDQVDGKPFYVMDFYANNLGAMIGESYRTEKPTRRLSVDKALDYTRQTLHGLDCLHDAGILHRDIKPFNLLITAQDRLKICDFGLSKLRGETFSGPVNLNVGSPYYAAPEQENDPDSVDHGADLYPVGVILYRMLTGRLPQQGTQDEPYHPPSALNSDLDDHWDTFIAHAMAVDPGQRVNSAKGMLAELNELSDHWQTHKESTCALPRDDTPPLAPKPITTRLRRQPVKVRPNEAADRFGTDDLWRPAPYRQTDFGVGPHHTIVDHAAGLVWQQGGSAYPRTWDQSHGFIQSLNEQKTAGRQNWRLPTVDELMTLLRPPDQTRDLCIAPLFDPTQRWIWSCDRRSYTAAYYVDAELGFVGWQDISAPYYVRAVCSINS